LATPRPCCPHPPLACFLQRQDRALSIRRSLRLSPSFLSSLPVLPPPGRACPFRPLCQGFLHPKRDTHLNLRIPKWRKHNRIYSRHNNRMRPSPSLPGLPSLSPLPTLARPPLRNSMTAYHRIVVLVYSLRAPRAQLGPVGFGPLCTRHCVRLLHRPRKHTDAAQWRAPTASST
jgi:hypothetical protein